MPGTTVPITPEMQKSSEDFSKGMLSGVLSVPKNIAFDLPDMAMRVFDHFTNPEKGAQEPIRQGLEAASNTYTKLLNAAMNTSDDQAGSSDFQTGDIVGGVAAWPVGIASKAGQASSLIGKAWRTLDSVINPTSLPGRIAAGAGTAALVNALRPGDAQAQQLQPQDEILPGEKPYIPQKAGVVQPTSGILPGESVIHPATLEAKHQEDSNSLWGEIAAGFAAAGVTALLWKAHKAQSAAQLAMTGDTFGADVAKTVLSPTDILKQSNVDSATGMKAAVAATDPTALKPFTDDVTNATSAALNSKIIHATETGEIAGSAVHLPAIADNARITASLPPQIQKVVGEGIMAGSQLSDARRGLPFRKFKGWEEALPQVVQHAATLNANDADAFVRTSIGDLMRQRKAALDQLAAQHPDVAQIVNMDKDFYKGGADYMLEQRLIDPAFHQQLLERDYMPYQAAPEPTNWLKKGWNILTKPEEEIPTHDQISALFLRENTDDVGLMPRIEAQQQYLRTLMRYAAHNSIKRQVIDAVKAAPPGSQFAGTISDATNTMGVKNMVTIRRDGVVENYKVNDPYLALSLNMNPSAARSGIVGLANASRQLMQTFTTGAGSLFWPKGLLYDMAGISAFADPGMRVSLLKMPMLVARGMAQGVGPTAAKHMSLFLKTQLATDGVLTKLFSPQQMDILADRMAQTWRGSLQAKFISHGGNSAGRMVDDGAIGGMLSSLKDTAPAYAIGNPIARNAHQLWSAYKGIFEAMQNSARLGYFSHVGGDSPIFETVQKASAATRRATGDFSQTGNGFVHQQLSAIVPYYNITIQSLARFSGQIAKNPKQVLPAVILGMALPSALSAVYASGMGKEYSDYYWNRMSTNDRVNYVYLPIPGLPPEKGIFIPVMPEWRPFHAMLVNAMDAIFGFSTGVINTPGAEGYRNGLEGWTGARLWEDVKQGVVSGISPFSVPPIALAGINAMGGNISGGGGYVPQIAALHDETLTGLDTNHKVRGEIIPRNVEEMITSLLGTTGQAFVHASLAAQQGLKGSHGGLGKAFGNAVTAAAMDETHGIPLAATIWSPGERITASGPIDNLYYDKKKIIDKVVLSNRLDIRNAGVTTRGMGGVPLPGESGFNPGGGNTDRFIDSQVAYIVQSVAAKWQQFQRAYGSKINGTRNEIQGVQSDNDTSPTEKAKLLNTLYKRLQDYHKDALNYIDLQIQQPLNKHFQRNIDLSKLDYSTKITDFSPLQ